LWLSEIVTVAEPTGVDAVEPSLSMTVAVTVSVCGIPSSGTSAVNVHV
jgi:hypothetical protein